MGNGIYDSRDKYENTLYAAMRRMGYLTAMIGKAHLICEWIRGIEPVTGNGQLGLAGPAGRGDKAFFKDGN
jgi:hypothetical protein